MKPVLLAILIFIGTNLTQAQTYNMQLRKESDSIVEQKAFDYLGRQWSVDFVNQYIELSKEQLGLPQAVLFNVKGNPCKQGKNIMAVFMKDEHVDRVWNYYGGSPFLSLPSSGRIVDTTMKIPSQQEIKNCISGNGDCILWMDKDSAIAIAQGVTHCNNIIQTNFFATKTEDWCTPIWMIKFDCAKNNEGDIVKVYAISGAIQKLRWFNNGTY
jgi:hypothetical protein